MLKLFFYILIISVAGGFLIEKIPSLRQSVVEIINPAAKEARLLDELKNNLNQLDANISSAVNEKNSNDTKQKIKSSKELLDTSKSLLNDAAKLNSEGSGLLRQAVEKIIDVFVDKTPFPADHLKPAGTGLIIPVLGGTPVICPQ